MFFLRIFEIDDVIVAITTLGATMVAHVSCVEFHGESFDGLEGGTKRIRP